MLGVTASAPHRHPDDDASTFTLAPLKGSLDNRRARFRPRPLIDSEGGKIEVPFVRADSERRQQRGLVSGIVY